MARVFHPMPEDVEGQERVHATIPKEIKRRFTSTFPHNGMIQYAIRLIIEVLPEMARRDEVYKEIAIKHMQDMFAADRAKWEADKRPRITPVDVRSPLDAPAATLLDEADDILNELGGDF